MIAVGIGCKPMGGCCGGLGSPFLPSSLPLSFYVAASQLDSGPFCCISNIP